MKLLFCSMHLCGSDELGEPSDFSGDFRDICDGGPSVVRLVLDPESDAVVHIEWNGEA